MKPRNARMLDDLLAKANGKEVYKFIRDGNSSDVAEVLGGLERRIDSPEAREAFINFAWVMLEARPTNGAEESRKRDALADKVMAGLSSNKR